MKTMCVQFNILQCVVKKGVTLNMSNQKITY